MVWESVVARRLAWREDLSLLDGFLISCRRAVYSNEPRVLAPTSQWVGHSARVSVCVCVYVCVGDCRFLEARRENQFESRLHS